MARYIPKINQPVEGVEHPRWLQKWRLDQEKLNAQFLLFMARSGKETSTGARQTSVVNNNTVANTVAIEELRGREGVPEGGSGGWVLRRAADYGGLIWGVDRLGVEPQCEIHLGDWDPDVSRVLWYGDMIPVGGVEDETVAAVMGSVEVWNDGANVSFAEAGFRSGGGFDAPARFDISIEPRFDGEEFRFEFPYDQQRADSFVAWSHFDIGIANLSTLYEATLIFAYMGGATYAGTRVAPGEWYDDPGESISGDFDFRTLTLATSEQLSWRVENLGGPSATASSGAQIVPAIANRGGATGVAGTGDRWWETNVKGRELCFPFASDGTVTVATLAHTFYNDRREPLGISLIRASVGTAPTGADIEVDVLVDGVSILASPLVITAGDTTGTATPASSDWPLGATGVYPATVLGSVALGLWGPGQAVTVEVLQVGSTIAGADLTVQIWAG